MWNKHYSVCEQNVDAGKNTLIFISDGLGQSICCRKMERTRPMKEEMDENVVYFPPESAFRLGCFNNVCNFPYLYLDLACKELSFSPKKRYKRRNESAKGEVLLFSAVLIKLPTIVNSLRCIIGNVYKTQTDFLSAKR